MVKKLPSTQTIRAEQLLVRRKQSANSVEKSTVSTHLITMEINMSTDGNLSLGRKCQNEGCDATTEKEAHKRWRKLQQQREQSVKYVEQNMEI